MQIHTHSLSDDGDNDGDNNGDNDGDDDGDDYGAIKSKKKTIRKKFPSN